MAIFLDQLDPNPINLNYMATKFEAGGVTAIPRDRDIDFCFCDFECEFTELALVNIGGESWENDKSDFLFALVDESDTAEFKIYKDGELVETIVNDNYGTFTPVGGFADYPTYIGLQLEWANVAQVYGFGTYRIDLDAMILGAPTIFASHDYLVRQYSDEIADRTVKLTTFQNGNIESSRLDFTGLNWEQNMRLDGRFFAKNPELQKDRYQNSVRRKNQIQDSIPNTYTLVLERLPSSVYNKVVYNYCLANRFLITDYNTWREEDFLNIEVDPEEFEEPTWNNRTRKRDFTIIFTDRFDNNVKRNFR